MNITIRMNATEDSVTVNGETFDRSKMDSKARDKFRVELVKGFRDLNVVKS